MPLVKCSDCGTEVSDLAATCPKCARPIAGQPRPGSEYVQPIEKTGKKYKSRLIYSWILILVGVGINIIAIVVGTKDHPGIIIFAILVGFPMMLIGALWATATRIMAWWHHA